MAENRLKPAGGGDEAVQTVVAAHLRNAVATLELIILFPAALSTPIGSYSTEKASSTLPGRSSPNTP